MTTAWLLSAPERWHIRGVPRPPAAFKSALVTHQLGTIGALDEVQPDCCFGIVTLRVEFRSSVHEVLSLEQRDQLRIWMALLGQRVTTTDVVYFRVEHFSGVNRRIMHQRVPGVVGYRRGWPQAMDMDEVHELAAHLPSPLLELPLYRCASRRIGHL